MKEIYKNVGAVIITVELLIAMYCYIFIPFIPINTMEYGVLLNIIKQKTVDSITVDKNSEYVTVTLKDISDSPSNQYKVQIADQYYLKGLAEENDIKIIEKQRILPTSPYLRVAIIFLLFVLINIFYFLYKRKKDTIVKVIGDTASGKAEEIQNPNVTFEDVAGLDEEKNELIEIVDFLKYPERYTKLGAKVPRGILLDGKPGTGKTLLAKAVAGEAGVTFITASGSEFINKYIGVGADNVKKMFKRAREEAPCIIFIDEIDAIGVKRSDENNGGDSERNQTIDQLLTELDGFRSRNDIIILAATNHPDILDPALTRPGRFDRTIHIGLPDVSARTEILKLHAKNKPLFEDVRLDEIAKNTAGFSGAELENLLNESAIHAARHQHEAISNEDISEAFKKITVGIKKKGRIISEEEKKITAIHEAGHSVVSMFMPSEAKIKEVSIIPHGKAGGYTWSDKAEDKQYTSKNEIMERLSVLMAGRAAEQVVIGDISTGATMDIETATQIATNMVSIYGMDSEVGPISIKSIDIQGMKIVSDKTLDTIGGRITNIVKEAENNAISIIIKHRVLLDQVVELLLEKETITGEDIQKIYDQYILEANAK